jgi:hypothetical protein
MLLPGRLSDTTLGDLLGTLCRARATGKLVLIEDRGTQHIIVVREGLVHEVETQRGPRLGELLKDAGKFEPQAAQLELRLGEFMLATGQISAARLGLTLRRLHLIKLDCLFSIEQASIRFHVARPHAPDAVVSPPLEPQAFLEGRPRRRGADARPRRSPTRAEALRVLGLAENVSSEDIRQAFRTLAQRCHPDRHPHLSPLQKTRLIVEFSELSHAYHSLVG